MAEKRKKIVLTIKEKLEVIAKFEKGESAAKLAKEYGIGQQTVRDIKRNKLKLVEFSSLAGNGEGPSKRKSMRKSPFEELDKAMLEWLDVKRSEGASITGPMCTSQAKIFHKALELEGDFNASSGWFTRFKQRYSIYEIAALRTGANCSVQAVNAFCKELHEFLAKENLNPEQTYNASGTELYWKALPTQMVDLDKRRHADDYKPSKERITVMCCSNATGQHKLRVLVVGKVKKLQLFKKKEICKSPVDYYYQKGGWMDPDIFTNWFHQNFVPQVRSHLESKGLPPKAVLLIDNSPLHKTEGILASDDGLIFVKHFPPDVSSSVQPMNQGVILSLKRHYRTGLFKTLVREDANLMTLLEQTTLLDSIFGISKAWEQVKPMVITRSWKKIFPDLEENDFEEFNDDLSNSELDALLYDVDGCGIIDREKLKEWLESEVCETDYNDIKGSYSILRTVHQPEETDEFKVEESIEEVKEVETDEVSLNTALH